MIRNIRHIMAAVVLSLASVQAMAQDWSVGVTGGYTHNFLTKDNAYAYDLHYKARGGFTVSVPVQVDFYDWLGVRADLSYMQKNYKMERQLMLNNMKVTNHYFQLPVMAHMSFGGERLRGYVNLGVYAGYWTSSHRKGITTTFVPQGEIVTFSDNHEFNDEDRRWDTGFVGGLGLEYKLGNAYTIFGEANFYYSTTSQTRLHTSGSHPCYNNTIATQVGVRFNLKELFK